MRTHLTRLGAAAAAVGTALALAACSAPDEATTAFCDSFDSLETLGTTSADAADAEAAAANQLGTVVAELESVEPPAEIAESYDLVTESFRTLSDLTDEALADPEQADQEALAAASQAMTTEDFGDAMTQIGAFTEQNCS